MTCESEFIKISPECQENCVSMNTLESLSIDKLEASDRTLAMALMILAREVSY